MEDEEDTDEHKDDLKGLESMSDDELEALLKEVDDKIDDQKKDDDKDTDDKDKSEDKDTDEKKDKSGKESDDKDKSVAASELEARLATMEKRLNDKESHYQKLVAKLEKEKADLVRDRERLRDGATNEKITKLENQIEDLDDKLEDPNDELDKREIKRLTRQKADLEIELKDEKRRVVAESEKKRSEETEEQFQKRIGDTLYNMAVKLHGGEIDDQTYKMYNDYAEENNLSGVIEAITHKKMNDKIKELEGENDKLSSYKKKIEETIEKRKEMLASGQNGNHSHNDDDDVKPPKKNKSSGTILSVTEEIFGDESLIKKFGLSKD